MLGIEEDLCAEGNHQLHLHWWYELNLIFVHYSSHLECCSHMCSKL